MSDEFEKRHRNIGRFVYVIIGLAVVINAIYWSAVGMLAIKAMRQVEDNGGVANTIGKFIGDIKSASEESN